jgi:hypothetical protein
VLATAWSGTAFAGPEAWYEEGFGDCADKYFDGGNFRCNICGVEAGCDGDACFWGSVKANATNSGELSEALGKGFQVYCVNQGGAMLPTESPAGIQLRAADQAFRAVEADEAYVGGLPLSLGGALNFASGGVKGVAIPWSTGYASETSAFDMSGALLAGQGEGFHQFGLSLRPGLRFHTEPGTSETMSFLGLAAPGLIVVNGGDKLDTDVGYQVGGGLMGGLSFETGGGARLGAGVAADAAYAHAFRIPTQVLLRYWVPTDTGAFVVQPGVSLNPAAGGAIGDTVSVNGLAGLEWGEWVFGAQAFLQSDVKGVGLGATHQGELARAVARGSLEERPAGQGARDEAFRPGDKVILTLKEGGEVRGTLTRYEPGQGYRVDLEDGSSRGLLWSEVSRATRQAGIDDDSRVGQMVVLSLWDGTRLEGKLVSMRSGTGVRVQTDGAEKTFAWERVKDVRDAKGVVVFAAAPPPEPATTGKEPMSASERAALDLDWEDRGGARFLLGVAGQAVLFVKKLTQESVGDMDGFFRFGGGGGVAVRTAVLILSPPVPSTDSTGVHGFRFGTGVDLGGAAAQNDIMVDEKVVGALVVHVPAYLGFQLGDGSFEDEGRSWSGVLWGLDYQPSYSYVGYDVVSKDFREDGVTWRKHARGDINPIGIGTTLDFTSLEAGSTEPLEETHVRIHASCTIPNGDHRLFATLGVGAVWY